MVLGALDARVEAVARECNPQEVSNTMWPYATKERKAGEWVLGALDPKGLVLANDFTAHRIVLAKWAYAIIGAAPSIELAAALSAREDALYVGGPTRTGNLITRPAWVEVEVLLSPMLVASACRFSTNWVERTVTGSSRKGTTQLPAAAAAVTASYGQLPGGYPLQGYNNP